MTMPTKHQLEKFDDYYERSYPELIASNTKEARMTHIVAFLAYCEGLAAIEKVANKDPACLLAALCNICSRSDSDTYDLAISALNEWDKQ